MSTISCDIRSVKAARAVGRIAEPEPAFVTRVRLRAQHRVLWLRKLWTAGDDEARGLAIAHDEVDRILADPASLARAEQMFEEQDAGACALASPIRAADLATAADPILWQLRREFSLGDHEVDLLTLAAAIEAAPPMRRLYGYIHDDATAGFATQWLAQQLFRWPSGTRLGADSNLWRWRMVRPADARTNPWSITSPWEVDAHVARCLLQGISVDARLGSAVRLIPPDVPGPATCLYPGVLATMTSFVRAMAARDTLEIVVAGAPGAGRCTLAIQLCRELQVPLLVADARALLAPGHEAAAIAESLLQVTRSARLLRAAVYWQDADAAGAAAWTDPGERPALSIFGTAGAEPATRGIRRAVCLPPLTRAARAAFWSTFSREPPPALVLDWPLRPLDISRAAAAAPAGPDAVIEACRSTLPADASSLAARLPRPYARGDLVLAQPVRRHLDELEAQARHRWTIYEEWGFERLCPMGRGITALFAGPSGTGKTMAAQVLAKSLGMEIYRVDLASVVSKYIGETEKNLRQVFDACDRSNVLLFFDEADALFGQRTQVRDAHDRFANIEIDYLLQRMEQFDGLAILATNRRGDLDPAFLRRVRFIVEFLVPGVPERRTLWTVALPERATDGTPLLDAVDFDLLAQRLDMTGADIKSAAMAAAFLARNEGRRIGMAHVLHAARRELAKRGMTLRATLGE